MQLRQNFELEENCNINSENDNPNKLIIDKKSRKADINDNIFVETFPMFRFTSKIHLWRMKIFLYSQNESNENINC